MKIENPTLNTIESNTVTDSFEALFALKFKQDIDGGKIDIVSLDTDEKIKEAILSKFKRHPKIGEASLDGVVAELKKKRSYQRTRSHRSAQKRKRNSCSRTYCTSKVERIGNC